MFLPKRRNMQVKGASARAQSEILLFPKPPKHLNRTEHSLDVSAADFCLTLDGLYTGLGAEDVEAEHYSEPAWADDASIVHRQTIDWDDEKLQEIEEDLEYRIRISTLHDQLAQGHFLSTQTLTKPGANFQRLESSHRSSHVSMNSALQRPRSVWPTQESASSSKTASSSFVSDGAETLNTLATQDTEGSKPIWPRTSSTLSGTIDRLKRAKGKSSSMTSQEVPFEIMPAHQFSQLRSEQTELGQRSYGRDHFAPFPTCALVTAEDSVFDPSLCLRMMSSSLLDESEIEREWPLHSSYDTSNSNAKRFKSSVNGFKKQNPEPSDGKSQFQSCDRLNRPRYKSQASTAKEKVSFQKTAGRGGHLVKMPKGSSAHVEQKQRPSLASSHSRSTVTSTTHSAPSTHGSLSTLSMSASPFSRSRVSLSRARNNERMPISAFKTKKTAGRGRLLQLPRDSSLCNEQAALQQAAMPAQTAASATSVPMHSVGFSRSRPRHNAKPPTKMKAAGRGRLVVSSS